MTVDNVAYSLKVRGAGKSSAGPRREFLDLVRMSDFAIGCRRNCRGQQQRVALRAPHHPAEGSPARRAAFALDPYLRTHAR